ncbi:MAG TPA: nucleoid occlusion protein [Clostridiales bacterium]|nr:nucleoid occlusion protein [Clostridiales bacterium]
MFEKRLSFINFGKEKKKKKESHILYLNPEEIKKSPHQPRKIFDTGSLTELSESISAHGIIQPINVRKVENGTYELVTGERRLMAAMMAGLSRIPCMVLDVDDNSAALIALIENLHREDLNCIEEAEAYKKIMLDYHMTQEELGLEIGKSQSAIANKIRLLRLPVMVKTVIMNDRLSERHARCLLQINDEEDQLKVLRSVRENNLNVHDTEMLVKNIIDGFVAGEKCKKTQVRRKSAVMDIRIFVNTVRQAIDLMIKSGIDAETMQTDNDEFYEFVVKIPKQ